MDEARTKLYALRRTDFGFHGKTTEKAQTGGWGRGPGNNVSNTLRGVNQTAEDMATHMDRTFKGYFKARRKARRVANAARRTK